MGITSSVQQPEETDTTAPQDTPTDNGTSGRSSDQQKSVDVVSEAEKPGADNKDERRDPLRTTDTVEDSKLFEDRARVLPTNLSPKTYADATNLAAQYPEFASNILSLPLASASQTTSKSSSPPLFNASNQPKHTPNRPNWALARDPQPQTSMYAPRGHLNKPATRGKHVRNSSQPARDVVHAAKVERHALPVRVARSATRDKFDAENTPPQDRGTQRRDTRPIHVRAVQDGRSARGREGTRRTLHNDPPVVNTSALALVQKAIQETREAGAHARANTARGSIQNQGHNRTKSRTERASVKLCVVNKTESDEKNPTPAIDVQNAAVARDQVEVKEAPSSAQVSKATSNSTPAVAVHTTNPASEAVAPVLPVSQTTRSVVAPAEVKKAESASKPASYDSIVLQAPKIEVNRTEVALSKSRDLGSVATRFNTSTRRATTEYFRRRARERSVDLTAKQPIVLPQSDEGDQLARKNLSEERAQQEDLHQSKVDNHSAPKSLPAKCLEKEEKSAQVKIAPNSPSVSLRDSPTVAQSPQPTCKAESVIQLKDAIVALPDLVEDNTPPCSEANTPESAKAMFSFNPKAITFTPRSSPSPGATIARTSPPLTSSPSPAPLRSSSMTPLKYMAKSPSTLLYYSTPPAASAPLAHGITKPSMPSPLAYSYTPEQKAYHSFGYGAFPAKSMAPSFVPEMSPVTRDALELALEYAQTQAQAEAWALEEQQAKLLGMLASGAPGTSSRLGAGRSVTMPRLTHTPAKRNAHSVQDTMFTGTPPLSSNAAAACFGYRGPLAPASVNRTLIGERYGRFVREWGGEDASHVGHRRPRSLGGGMGNGFGYGGMN